MADTTASGGSIAFFTLALLVISLLVLLLIRHYLPLRATPAYLTVPVFLALFLPASIILLVPIDLASHAVEEDATARGISLPDGTILVAWRISYWLTFILTWLILPLLAEYSDAGFRDTRARLIYSVRSNIRYQLTVLTIGLLGLAYFLIQGVTRINLVKGLVVALAYTWGLMLAIYLMGHGLVALPRAIFRTASVSARLRQLQSQAPRAHDNMTQALISLEDAEAQVWQLKRTKTHGRLQDWVDELADSAELPESRAGRATANSASVPAIVTERYLADLTRKLKRARHKRIRFVQEWDTLVRRATQTQAILDAAASQRLDFGPPPASAPFYARIRLLTPSLRYHVYARMLPALQYLLSFILALASVALIWTESLNPVSSNRTLSLVRLTVVHHPSAQDTGKIGFAGQLIAALWLCYMSFAALYSIRAVPLWGTRALVRRHTYPESAAWYAAQVAKLTVPLSFNFINLLPSDLYTDTTFYTFLGRLIDLTPLLGGFNAYFPVFILIPVLAALFNLYGKIKSVLGFGILDDEEPDSGFGTGGWREGQALIERDRLDRGLDLSSDPTSHGLLSSSSSQLESTLPHTTPRTTSNTTPRTTSNTTPRAPPPSTTHQESTTEEGEDQGFFADFTHRVRNTFETSNIDFSLPKRPKWMSLPGSQGMANGETSGRAEFGGALGRWFGGRPDDGRVRL